MAKKKLKDSFWMDGFANYVYEDKNGKESVRQKHMSEYEFLYGEYEPGDIYTEWMPRYGGYQPDDND